MIIQYYQIAICILLPLCISTALDINRLDELIWQAEEGLSHLVVRLDLVEGKGQVEYKDLKNLHGQVAKHRPFNDLVNYLDIHAAGSEIFPQDWINALKAFGEQLAIFYHELPRLYGSAPLPLDGFRGLRTPVRTVQMSLIGVSERRPRNDALPAERELFWGTTSNAVRMATEKFKAIFQEQKLASAPRRAILPTPTTSTISRSQLSSQVPVELRRIHLELVIYAQHQLILQTVESIALLEIPTAQDSKIFPIELIEEIKGLLLFNIQSHLDYLNLLAINRPVATAEGQRQKFLEAILFIKRATLIEHLDGPWRIAKDLFQFEKQRSDILRTRLKVLLQSHLNPTAQATRFTPKQQDLLLEILHKIDSPHSPFLMSEIWTLFEGVLLSQQASRI